MKKFKQISTALCFILIPIIGLCQNQPPAFSAAVSADWHRGTNNGGGFLWPNVIGTSGANTNPLYFATNGNVIAKFNSTYAFWQQYTINSYGFVNGVNTSGYVGIGENNSNLWSTKGPFSMLHLNGNNYMGFAQEFGYRPWMKS